MYSVNLAIGVDKRLSDESIIYIDGVGKWRIETILIKTLNQHKFDLKKV